MKMIKHRKINEHFLKIFEKQNFVFRRYNFDFICVLSSFEICV